MAVLKRVGALGVCPLIFMHLPKLEWYPRHAENLQRQWFDRWNQNTSKWMTNTCESQMLHNKLPSNSKNILNEDPQTQQTTHPYSRHCACKQKPKPTQTKTNKYISLTLCTKTAPHVSLMNCPLCCWRGGGGTFALWPGPRTRTRTHEHYPSTALVLL